MHLPSEDPRRLETDTRSVSDGWTERIELRIPALTILCHPDRRRVGERTLLSALATGRSVLLSRLEPGFAHPGERQERPLEDSRISRSPVRLRARIQSREAGGLGSVRLDASESGSALEIDGQELRDEVELDLMRIEAGVVLWLSRCTVLLLHLADPIPHSSSSDLGLVGASDAIGRVRSEILRLASLDVPVLLRGESGTGKELVATALHSAGRRAAAPFIAVNMAAIPQSLAAAELFGASKGAYTGASRNRLGAFRRANGGTLFLDEIGDTAEEVQALLLRALESGEVLPVGGERAVSVDVRLITATDLGLEEAIEHGRFRSPLFHRIAGYELELASLQQRREDFGRLFFHFLEMELKAMGGRWPDAAKASPWPPSAVMARLAARPWPGNVRQLRNAARQLAILGPDASQGRLARWLDSAGQLRPTSPSATPQEVSTARPRRSPAEIGDADLKAVLRACRFRIQDTAERLGISRAAVYKLIDRSPSIRKASDLDRDEIAIALNHCGGDVAAMVDRLEVSAPALRRRMRQLGFD